MWTITFWRDTAERAIKTAAQTIVGLLVAGATILDIDWVQAGAVVATAALASVLTSLVSSGVGVPGTPSMIDEGKWRRGRRVE